MATGLPEIGPPMSQMTMEKLELVRAKGLRCGAYGANSREQIRMAFDMELTSFTTDRPDWAIEERDDRACSAP
jgi:hypothetical protein